jgi:hypothetical protein
VTAPPSDPLLRFYRLEAPDDRGRMLDEIWRWDAARLEATHDYIQWLFPLAERSAFNPGAPTLTPATIAAFRADDRLRQRLERSLTTMLAFYGLALSIDAAGHPDVAQASDFAVKARGWLHAGDHNHLRLTRILTSLRLLGLEEMARALLACLERIAREHPHAVSSTTLNYWRKAVT